MNQAALLFLPAVVAFAIVVLAGGPYIAWLRAHNLGKQIREELPESHQLKIGTPTIGGWLFILAIVAVSVAVLRDWRIYIAPLAALALFGLYGTLDDLNNLRSASGLGYRVRWKFPIHGAMALAIGALLYLLLGVDSFWAPLLGEFNLGIWFVPFAALVIFSTSAAVNEADGLDGLAGGLAAQAFAVYAVIAVLSGMNSVAVFCFIVVGSLLGYLWFNVKPASVYMGDTGSLALGACLGTVALLVQQPIILILVGLVFVAETVSVIMQVAYFKMTGGKRIFKMTPLHHHFELSGWSEVQTVQRFWLVGAVSGLLALGVLLL